MSNVFFPAAGHLGCQRVYLSVWPVKERTYERVCKKKSNSVRVVLVKPGKTSCNLSLLFFFFFFSFFYRFLKGNFNGLSVTKVIHMRMGGGGSSNGAARKSPVEYS